MATQEDVRRIALGLPGVREDEDRFAFGVDNRGKRKEIAWVWLERPDPKQPRVANHDVIGVRVANAAEKQALLDADDRVYFTEPHYNGFPAVLVRLAEIGVDELAELLTDAWRCQAPKDLVRGAGG